MPDVPNKTIYVSDDDLPIYGRAQELAGGNLSAAISRALRRFVDDEEGRREGYKQFTVRVGPTPSRKIRFTGALLGELASTSNGASERVRVFGTRSGKYVIHTERSEGFTMVDSQGKPAGWRGHLGIGDVSYGTIPARSVLDIVDDLDGVREKVPPPLYDIVISMVHPTPVEDLEI
jgi:EXLDI family protein